MGVCSLLFRCSLSCQWSGHSGSCQGEAVLHASAPAPMSNFTLEWICAEHANSHITKQIKSARKARGVCLRVCPCVCCLFPVFAFPPFSVHLLISESGDQLSVVFIP